MRKSAFILLVCLLAGLAGCDKSKGGGGGAASSGYAQSDSPDNLKGLLEEIIKSNEAGDKTKAAAMTRALIPSTKEALTKAVKDDATEFIDRALEAAKTIPADDAQVAGLIKRGEPNRTQVNVHAATTEEIAEYKPGSTAANEFPGGAQKLAQQLLKPGVKFYEVEFVEPGKDAGMKFHMFYWDGSTWRMLGPAWRALKQ